MMASADEHNSDNSDAASTGGYSRSSKSSKSSKGKGSKRRSVGSSTERKSRYRTASSLRNSSAEPILAPPIHLPRSQLSNSGGGVNETALPSSKKSSRRAPMSRFDGVVVYGADCALGELFVEQLNAGGAASARPVAVVESADDSGADMRSRCVAALRQLERQGVGAQFLIWLPPDLERCASAEQVFAAYFESAVSFLVSLLPKLRRSCLFFFALGDVLPAGHALLPGVHAAKAALENYLATVELPAAVSVQFSSLNVDAKDLRRRTGAAASSSSVAASSSSAAAGECPSSSSLSSSSLSLVAAASLVGQVKSIVQQLVEATAAAAPTMRCLLASSHSELPLGPSSLTSDAGVVEAPKSKKRHARVLVELHYDTLPAVAAIGLAELRSQLAAPGSEQKMPPLLKAAASTKTTPEVGLVCHLLAAHGQLVHIKQAVKAGYSINGQTIPDMWTPLHVATSLQRWDVVKFLLKKGADPNLLSFQMISPLHMLVHVVDDEAQLKRAVPTLKLFLDKGIDIDIRNIAGHTPLIVAASAGKTHWVSTLMKLTASWNVLDRNGETALYHALRGGHTATVRKLLELGVNPKCRGKHTPLPLELSCSLTASARQLIETWVPRSGQTSQDGMPKQTERRTVVYADNFEQLPAKIQKLVLRSGIDAVVANANFGCLRSALRFAVRTQFLPTNQRGADGEQKKKTKAPVPRVNHGGKSIETLFAELITPGNPKKFFKMIDTSGKGGFGSVFYAKSTLSKERIAVKKMPHATDKEIQQNLDEVYFLRRLRHPNVVSFSAAYTIRDEIWVVMEFMEGGTLAEAVRICTMTEPQIAYCCQEILRALEFLHEQGIVHRDLKSANIMMSIQGDVKVIDFGLALCLHNIPPPVSLVGSPFWIPPEMLRQEPHGTPADIWSFGICTIELAEGDPPFRRNCLKGLFSVATGTPPRLREKDGKERWSQLFTDFVSCCLTIDQTKRGTATQLLAHPFLECAATRRSMKQILQHLFIEKSLEKSLGMRGF